MIQDDDFIAEGTSETELLVECSRCLEPITVNHKIVFHDIYLKNKADLEKYEEDFPGNIFYVDKGHINLDDSMSAALEENKNNKILCSNDCKGLCSSCGKSLNKVKCNCEEKDIDPRLEALKKFKV